MKCSVKIGDVLEEHADVLICPANPELNLSGGVNLQLKKWIGQKDRGQKNDDIDFFR